MVAGAFLIATLFLSAARSVAQIPEAIAVPGEIPATLLHAEGAQIYQCAAGPHDQLVWQPREPIATLMRHGNTVGRHYGGMHLEQVDAATPRWEHNDGSSVRAKIVATVAGITVDDLPRLKFRVVSQNGDGLFYGVSHVQRINTRGGVVQGSCDKAGSLLSVPYSADYLFWLADGATVCAASNIRAFAFASVGLKRLGGAADCRLRTRLIAVLMVPGICLASSSIYSSTATSCSIPAGCCSSAPPARPRRQMC